MSQAQDYVDHYIPDVSKRKKLYEVLTDGDIPAIAVEMSDWEVKLVSPLGLTPGEVTSIHQQFAGTRQPELMRLVTTGKLAS